MRASGRPQIIESVHRLSTCQQFKKGGSIYTKTKTKVIADAEPHRRTPWTLGMKSADIGDPHAAV